MPPTEVASKRDHWALSPSESSPCGSDVRLAPDPHAGENLTSVISSGPTAIGVQIPAPPSPTHGNRRVALETMTFQARRAPIGTPSTPAPAPPMTLSAVAAQPTAGGSRRRLVRGGVGADEYARREASRSEYVTPSVEGLARPNSSVTLHALLIYAASGLGACRARCGGRQRGRRSGPDARRISCLVR